jgi:anti-anti-sigma factor
MIDEPVRVESRDGQKRSEQRILRVYGRLALPNADLRFLEKIRVETAPIVILDLSGVTFCDSSGVGALMQIHSSFKRENRRLALAAINERTALVLRIAQVLPYFTVFLTVDEAEATFV